MPELVLYGIRQLAPASLGKLSTNESRAWTFLDQWEWSRLVLLRESAGPGLDPVIFAFRRTAGHPETALVVTGIVSVVSPVVSCGGRVVLHPSYIALNLLFWGNFKIIIKVKGDHFLTKSLRDHRVGNVGSLNALKTQKLKAFKIPLLGTKCFL